MLDYFQLIFIRLCSWKEIRLSVDEVSASSATITDTDDTTVIYLSDDLQYHHDDFDG